VTKHSRQNIIITLCGTYTSETEEGHNDDDDDNDNDIDIPNEAIEAPNDNDYHELRPQHPNLAISYPHRS
jgi:hypothetical protein